MVAAVVLAAGGGTRFRGDTHKLRAPLRGRPVLVHALAAAADAGLELIVVTGAVDVTDLVPEQATVVHNPHWAEGQATSVRGGIAVAAGMGHDAVVVGLGDQPFVAASCWRAVAAADFPVAVATYDDGDGGWRRGHPVRLASQVWDLLPVAGDAVGRELMRSRPELVREIRCGDGDTPDIDTMEDLRRWS